MIQTGLTFVVYPAIMLLVRNGYEIIGPQNRRFLTNFPLIIGTFDIIDFILKTNRLARETCGEPSSNFVNLSLYFLLFSTRVSRNSKFEMYEYVNKTFIPMTV